MPSFGLNPGIAATPKATPRLSWPSAGGSSSNSGQYGPRAFPESIDLNRPIGPVQNPVMDAVAFGASLPARAYEMPLSVVNTLGKSKPEDKGPVDQLSDLVDSLPIVGDIAHGAGNVIEASGKVFPTFWNAPFASALKDTAGLPTDHVITPEQSFFANQNLGDLFGGRPFTVGQLRQQAFERGFTQADIAALASGRKGIFDFGGSNEQGQPYAVSPNQLLDVAGRLVLDPLNATVVLGPARLAKVIPGAERLLGLSKARALIREDAVLDRTLGAAVKGPRAGVRALAAGVTEGVSNRSVGLFLMGMSKGGGALLGTYRNAVAIPTAAAVGAVNVIDYALNGNDAPSGPFKDLFALGRAIADDRPLSQGMLFNLWAVTHFPVMDTVRGVTVPLNRAVRERMPRYRDIQASLVDRLVPGAAGDYKARLAKAVEQAGGEDDWTYLVDMLGRKWHADRIAQVEFQRNPATNMLELQESANLAGKLVDERMRANPGEFGGREADAALVDWATGARLTSNPSLRKAMGGLRSTFDPERFFVQFRQWLSVAKQVSSAFSGAPPVAPALRRTLVKEHLQVLKANLRGVVRDGVIPHQEATRLLLDHPALLEAEGGFWARAMIRDGQDIRWEWARDRLDRLIDSDRSYTISQVVAPGPAWQARREREAMTRTMARRPDGSYDLSMLEPSGSPTIHVPTDDAIARSDTMTLPDQLDDALAARANGTIDGEDFHALDMAGAKVLTASDGISIRDGALAPGKRVVMDPTTTPQMAAEVAAKLIGRTRSKEPAVIVYDEAGVMQHGLQPNAVRLQWRVGGMDDLQRQSAVAELDAISDLAWADHTTGVLTVILKRTDDIAGQAERASSRLGALFPDRAPDGLLRPQSERVWTETIRDTTRSRSGRAARAAGGERSVADVAAHGEHGTFWHAADVEFAGVDERRLAGVAGQQGPNQGPVGQAAQAGQLDGSPGDLDRGQVRPVPDVSALDDEIKPIERQLRLDRMHAPHATTNGVSRRFTLTDTGRVHLEARLADLRTQRQAILDADAAAAGAPSVGFHGSSERLDSLDPVFPYNSRDQLFGGGVYTTSNPSIARTYTVKNDGATQTPTVHSVRWVGDHEPRLLRAEDDLSTDLRDRLVAAADTAEPGTGDALMVDPAPATLETLWTRAKSAAWDFEDSATGNAIIDSMTRELRRDYDGIIYDGGQRVGNLDHQATVYFNAGDLAIAPRPRANGRADFALDRPAEATQFDLNYGSPLADYDPLEEGNGIREKVVDDPNLTPMERVRLAGLQEDLFRNDPTYTLEVIPKGGTPIRVGEHPFADMVIAKQAAGDAWSYRVGSALGNGMHAAFGRVYTKGLQDDMRQELMSSLVSKGATPSEVNGFLAALNVISQKVDLVFGHPRARADHLDPKTIRNVALGSDGGGVRVISGFDGFTPETLARLGGADKVPELLGKSASRVFRKLTQNHRAADGKGVMGKLLDATFGPSKRTFEGGTGRRLGYLRTYYPLLRFYLDPRWWLMNKFEADIIGAVRYGARRGEVARGDARAAAAFGGSEIDDLLAAGWLDQREEMGRIMARSFREERIDSATKAVEALASDSKELTALRERVGLVDGQVPTGRQLAEELDRMMYDYDVKGVPKTVEETARKVLDDAGYEAVRPLIGRLTDVNRKQWESLFNGFRGNVNRSNAERMLNSYFLYWPLSYQLKVAKLLVDTLTNRSFGRQTDMLGAWTIDRLWREHTDRLEHDRDYRAMFDENPTLWTMAGMMFPVTPFDIGLSESRITRYMQSNVGAYLGFWDKDGGYPSDPIEMASRIMNLGPLYTADLLAKANRELRE